MDQGNPLQGRSGEKLLDENARAEQAITDGDLAEGARILVSIVERDPENWRAYNNMGIVAWTRKAWHDAYAMFAKSVSINPTYSDALVNLFDAALKLKRIDEALPKFERALNLDPSLEEIRIIRDSIAEQHDEIYSSPRALAIGIYSPIIEDADRELDSGNLFKAMEKYLEANDKEGPTAAAFNGLGIISYYQQRFQDAFTLFVESLKLNPTDPDTYVNLLDAAKECGKVQKAVDIFNVYRTEFPSLESVAPDFEDAAKNA